MTPTFFLFVLGLLTSFQCGALSLKSIRTWKAESRFPVRAYALSQRQILNLNADCGDLVTLETSVHRYVRDKVEGSAGGEAANQDPDGPKVESKRCTEAIVDLFGVLHVADSSYYKELSGILEQYDVILYELITSNSNVDLIFGEDDHSLKSDLETAAKRPVKKKKQVSTKHKYLGAAMSHTGDIYGVPSHARKLLRISASGRLSLPSLVDSTTGEPINMNRKFKWLRGQVYRNSVYCIPAWADCVLKLSPSEEEEDTIQATELGKVEIGKAVQDLREAGQDARWLYHGAAEGRDECIYAIPCNAEFVLKIDPRTDKVSLVGATASAQFGKLFGVNNEARLPVGGNKWYGGIRGVDGCVYGMPYCTRDGVLKVTPPQSYSTDEEATVSVIPIHSPVVTSPRTMSPVGGEGDEEGKLCRWHGGILNPEDGYIYAIPSHSQYVLRVDTNLPGPGQLAGDTSGGGVVELLGGENHIPPGSYKWGGGAVGSDGRVYGIPSDSDKVLVVDPSPPTTAQAGAEDAQVRLLDIPSYANGVTDQQGGELPRINKWQGGLRVDRAIYCFPCNAVSVLKITTPEKGSTEAAVVEEIGVGVIPRGRCKWQGGNYNQREHCIYCVPEHGDSVLRIDCADDSVTLLPLPSDEGEGEGEGGEEGRREVSLPFSRPRRRLNTEIQSPTAAALATKYGLRTQLDLPMNADSRYFVADLDSETVAKMESEDGRRQRLRESYQVSQSEGLLGGSSARDLLFDRSTSAAATASRAQFRVDGAFLAAARLASWLTPAPEVTQLLLDWSRSRARATTGGLTLSSLNAACQFLLASFSPSTFFLPSREGLARARQILFAQQLVSGVADDGWFGGSALSDVGVRVEERNKAAVEVLQGVLADEDKPRVAVLYGVYHLKDLSRRLEDLGLRPVSGAEAEGSFEKEAPVLPPDNSLVAWRMAIPGGGAAAGGEEAVPVRRYAAALVVGSLYLVVSTLDWFVLLRLVIKAVEALPLLPSIASFSLANDALPVPVPTVSLDGVTDDQVVDFSLGVLYLGLYIRRHRDILVSFTTGIVDWNKGLYDEE